MRIPYFVSNFSLGFFGIVCAFFLFSIPVVATAAEVTTPEVIQGYIAHADPAKALTALSPILKNDPHSAKAWYLEAEAQDALGHDSKAKVALDKAEHLDPAMPFANSRSLSALEHRVGLTNVQASRSRSEFLVWLLGILLLLSIVGVGVFVYIRSQRRKAQVAVETERQDVLLEITEFLTGELNTARISAEAKEDSARLASIQEWQKSLVECTQQLKDAANYDALDEKRAVINHCEHLLAEIQAKLSGKPVITQADNMGWPGLNSNPGTASLDPVCFAPSQTENYRYGGGGGFGSGLSSGLGMGIGMEIAEDLMDGDSSANSGFGGGNDDSAVQPDNESGWGGTDDGLSSDSSSGWSDDGDSADDGFNGDDSGSADDGFDGGSDW